MRIAPPRPLYPSPGRASPARRWRLRSKRSGTVGAAVRSAVAGAVLRLPDGRRPQACQLGQAARVLPAARQERRTRCGSWSSARRARAVRTSRSSSRRRPISPSSISSSSSTPAWPTRAGSSEAEARKVVAEARAVVIQSFALHSSEVAASQTAAEFVYDSLNAHRRGSAADARQRDQHRRALDQSGRHADDRRLVHEVCRDTARGVGIAVALPEVFRPRQQPRRLRAQSPRVAASRPA